MANAGEAAGKGVAQIYASLVKIHLWEAPRRLVGFAKLSLNPKESTAIEVTVDPRTLATFDVKTKKWVVADGNY